MSPKKGRHTEAEHNPKTTWFMQNIQNFTLGGCDGAQLSSLPSFLSTTPENCTATTF